MNTKGKWEVKRIQNGIYVETEEKGVCEVWYIADAEYICKAVNNHDKLVKALERFTQIIDPRYIPFGELDKAEQLLKELE